MNTFGKNFRVTTFGESHGPAIGAIIDGFPPGIKIDFKQIKKEIAARRPGDSSLVSQRKETDEPEFLSGFDENGVSLGTPIGFIIRNNDILSRDYGELKDKYRPNHADYTYDMKYGLHEYRGGGRASARETANWVVAGALASQILSERSIKIETVLSGAGSVSYVDELSSYLCHNHSLELHSFISDNLKNKILKEIIKAKESCDSIGGSVTCVISGLKEGLGDPIFRKLQASLAQAMMSINAAKGFEYGLGMKASSRKGSDTLDIFKVVDGKVITETNYSGGIQGGISNGMPIFFNVAFKPTPTIMKKIPTIDYNFNEVYLEMKGRHDPCVAVRAVAVVKAMAALVLADYLI